jgi:peptide/nickel transport system permease protein
MGVQLLDYLGGVMRFDLGSSLHSDLPVSSLLASRIPATLQLAIAALTCALVLALPLGVLAALRRDSGWDWGAMGFSTLGVSIPNFWLGPLLILCFSLGLGCTPVSGRESAASLILPALTLGTGFAAILARMIRSSLLEVLGEDFVRTARAKGLSESQVIWRHALRNAWLPVLTLIGMQLGALLGGAVVTEVVFDWPGIGSLMIDAIQRRDYPVVQGCVLFVSLAYVLVNTLTDLLYGLVDPRIRQDGSR